MAIQAIDAYEELYKKKVEENKKKLQQIKLLNNPSLSRQQATVSIASPGKQLKRKAVQEGNFANNRCSNNTPVKICKKVTSEVVPKPTTKDAKKSKPRDFSDRVLASDEARSTATKKAQIVAKGLGVKHPSFVKPMLKSHTSGGFWLGLPGKFCKKHLPQRDSTIILEDEAGKKSNTTYLALKNGLSAGWRGFSVNHNLADGDALVFQLIEKTKFKVYITRAKK